MVAVCWRMHCSGAAKKHGAAVDTAALRSVRFSVFVLVKDAVLPALLASAWQQRGRGQRRCGVSKS